ncbi:Lcl C-terminal domain-containing protein [Salidesulfovibrio brasiliensis]|uniref:Lcl C-terminal domain-containing protein n=1 Tax=Salidesulfovibrio brasiliensis TaxID=221711 RepID=UPI0006D26F5C|nr:DUF1566 domain-containing protein [Salidesulfovibrio brasiliensis]
MSHYLNTGQTFCADENGQPVDCAESGQDAELRPGLPWPKPRFTRDGDTVRDELTGLVWLGNPNFSDFPLNHDEALAALKSLNSDAPGDLNEWRLPNRRELFSLISFNERKPALPSDSPFDKAPLGWFWSSTQSAMQPGYQWLVHTEGGRMFYGRRDSYCLLWPVCGESDVLPATGREDEATTGVPWPEQRFEAHGETVLDTLTGLWWTRSADLAGGMVTWNKALRVARELSIPVPQGGSPWSLPTMFELESVVDASQHSPALMADHPFTDTREAYWSCTSSSYEHDWAMCLYLHKGAAGVGFKTKPEFHVWAVSRT